jgi:cytochrome P450
MFAFVSLDGCGWHENVHMSDVALPSLEQFNPFDPRVQQCPHLYYQQMRDQTAAFQVPGMNMFMVTRHESIVPIVRDTTTFSNAFDFGGAPSGELAGRLGEVLADGWPRVPTMLTIDPPSHTRYRATVAPFFTPRRIAELRPAVVAIAERLLDSLPTGVFDVVPQLAVPLPIEVIADVLDVPADRMPDFKRWSDDSVANIGSRLTDDQQVAAMRGIVEMQHYFAAELERRRPGDGADLLSDLVHATVDMGLGDMGEGERPLEMAEMLSIVQQLLVAGNETTTKAITEGLLLLARHPDVWEALRADPAGMAPLVTEEVLRLSTPTQGMFRKVTADTEIDGVAVPAGAMVVLLYAAANRDPKVWGDDPDGFDPRRPNLKDHLAFGKGIHFCLGAPLSRLELQVLFESLGRRAVSLAVPDQDLTYHPSFVLRGLVRLDMEMVLG